VLTASVLLALGGCAAARRIQVFPVSIVDDTAAPVVVRDCDDYCRSSLLSFDLQPGTSVSINRTTNMHKRFSVTTPAGGRIGCVDLFFETAQPGTRVLVSQAAPCPAGSSPRWKLLVLVLLAGAVLALGLLAFSSRPRRGPTA